LFLIHSRNSLTVDLLEEEYKEFDGKFLDREKEKKIYHVYARYYG